jgi:hypothetical protein
MSAVQIRLPPPKRSQRKRNKIQHCHDYCREKSRMRMLEFKTSEKNLENCIISRNSKQTRNSKEKKEGLLVIEPIKN